MAATTDRCERTRSGASVRLRITAAVALLTVLALSGAGAIVYLIERGRVDDTDAQLVEQEFGELRALQQNGVDPSTGQPFATPRDVVRNFMARNVPADNELLVGWWDGASQLQSPAWDGVTQDDAFNETVAGLVAGNGTRTVDSSYGDLQVNVQTVEQGARSASLVVVVFKARSVAGLHDTMQTYAIVAGLSLLLVVGFAAAQSGRLLAPLRTLRETAEEVTDSDLSRRLPETGNDDITALTRTFNGMLDRLESAFVGQRQFLDDAGHELKTPLTVLRGHLELLDVGDPQEIAETRELLLDEVDRMSRLVGELILLAKSDRPDFVTLRPVDLTGLTVDTLSKARGLAPRTWTLDETASVTVPVDEQRLTQALLQLCDNAVKHTGPGDEVALGSSYDGRTARLWVRDTGPGVAPEHREVVFERFGRGAVPADDEGFGLGLSIVRAIARAHGGSVSYVDEQPHGARFVIHLPVSDDERPEPTGPAARRTDDTQTEELSLWPAS
ncbi:sensor histidine kinase [Nocardioides anomalus]|uniref:sensor histidine kinase n=1 Tax=Nocardioides anomalus TaxID=2712223 RepID=UPI001E4DE5C2|nr:HAMP domain-containing sensor histidine kinase [Nocardioides anomalus]